VPRPLLVVILCHHLVGHFIRSSSPNNTASRWWSTLPVEVCFQKPFNSLGAADGPSPRYENTATCRDSLHCRSEELTVRSRGDYPNMQDTKLVSWHQSQATPALQSGPAFLDLLPISLSSKRPKPLRKGFLIVQHATLVVLKENLSIGSILLHFCSNSV
jgi:hypothetical protein